MELREEKSRSEGEQKPTAPAISLPKGGGAIRGIGEKFAANPVTGTGSVSVPIVTSPGRSGFGPELSLSYDSGAGNGPFGLGWNITLPSITRKTDKGLPQYDDVRESDVFVLSGAEDLVPLLTTDGSRFEDTTTAPGYTIHRYRPRIEGLFARIERWTGSDGDIQWRSISRDNVLTLYGKDANSRIADKDDPHRIFTWLICETRDDKGNALMYEYKLEDGTGVDPTQAHERNRGHLDDPRRATNRYLKRIRYGNRLPLLDDAGQRPRFLTAPLIQHADWMFEVVFDYGEHNIDAPKPDDAGEWDFRNDPFSTYRAGFEVRTTRLCRRVLMFHHFPDEEDIGNDCLVLSTDFTYAREQDPASARNPVYTLLQAVTQSGYRREGGGYLKRSLPSVEFEYTQPVVQDTVEEVDPVSLENLPIGLDDAAYQWTDLHGEGIPGILTELADAWFYKRNLSPISDRPVEFAPLERVAVKPNLAIASGAQFMDLAGDGQPDLVVMDGFMSGLYEHDDAEGWQPFRPFNARLNYGMRDPNLKFVDLDGDGHTDVLVSEDDAFIWHASLAEDGFGPASRVAQALDEEKGPRLVFADGSQSIYLADFSGDGLTDLVRVRNGEVCYWPNLGYGRFGAKVTMDNSPHFDHPDQFDQNRIRLADIDGTGTIDIIYLHRDGVRLYFNQSGNSWSNPQPLRVFPRVDDLVNIAPADLRGNGTACLVWSSPLPGDTRRQMRYVELMGGKKPHLLTRIVNSLGAETLVEYAPSTKFYLRDKYAGRPWITRLPFPVHVVERVETHDHTSGNRFVTRYAYHHGYFDGEEREFRGFGMVEQWDTEKFAALNGGEALPETTNLDDASHVPSVLTRTWSHTGIYVGGDRVSDFFAGLLDESDRGEYYREPGLTNAQARERLLSDTIMEPGLTAEEEREACRALKGMMLRQEVYANDGTPKAQHPYIVTEQNFTIRCLQPRNGNRHAVFFTHAREAVSYHYERNPADPRISHALTLEADDFGNVLKSLAVGYGRRTASIAPELTDDDLTKQTRLLITYTENSFTEPVLAVDDYRTPLLAETRTHELTGFTPENNAARFSFDEWTRNNFALLASAAVIPYEQTADYAARQKRLIERVCTIYRKDDLTALLPPGKLEPLALPGESRKLALTQSLLAHVFKRTRDGQPDEDLLPAPVQLLEGRGSDQGGYIAIDGDWWIPSGRAFFDPDADITDPARTAAQERLSARQHFHLPRKVADPFDHCTFVDYEANDLLVARTRDALGNTIRAASDYRVLQPRLITDPNGNRTAVAFDALGMVTATAVMGKEGEHLGDLPEGFDADPPPAELQKFVADPQAQAASLLGKATTRIVYDIDRYRRAGQPPFTAMLARETHFYETGGDVTEIQMSFSYSDGFGREIQKKIQAEAGSAPQRLAPVLLPSGDVRPGDLVLDKQGQPIPAYTLRRWVGTGRTVYNNKGKPVRQYEPFFSAMHLYEPEREMTDTGVSSTLFYDPVGRVVATLHPNHTYEKVVFDSWQQTTYDVNDTVKSDPSSDDEVKGFFVRPDDTLRIPANEYQPTWYTQRIGNPAGDPERDAAEKAAAHADTPTIAHLDTLGRPFLTLADNGSDPNQPDQHLLFATRVELDIEGNQREVLDAKGRVVMRYDYDMLGNRIHQASMEAGERWMLSDTAGKPIRAWDSRLFLRRMTYDELRRPTGLYVNESGAERLAERTVYGESQGAANNHLARIYQVFDGAGIITSEAYDFKGNLTQSSRALLPDYKGQVDWQQQLTANGGTFNSSTTFDALNRPLTVISPDDSVYRPTFNRANLLDRVDVNLRGAATPTLFITNIDYNAKGQRERIAYGNGASTAYEYDPHTFRLTHLKTTRPTGSNGLAAQLFADSTIVQDLRYTYDPAGNITRIDDAALQRVFHNGESVEPVCEYTYDALYRLIEAHGREHIGQTAFELNPTDYNYRDYQFTGHRAHPNDLQALRNYIEYYAYDAVGNFETVRHVASGGNWRRAYVYKEKSQLEDTRQSNRLTRTIRGNRRNHVEPYSHDVHGNLTSMTHLPDMVWDFKDQLQQVDLGGGGAAYYVYDAAGQRVRKVIESQNGTRRNERIYLAGFEVYREYNGNGVRVTLERESLHVMDDKQPIALVQTKTVENGLVISSASLSRYQLGNHLGSTSVELDEDGALLSYEEYHPYGTTSFQAGRSAAEVSLKRYRYTGKERDEETGFSYHGARYYVSWIARWISADPSLPLAGLNAFVYANTNPISLIDPSGNAPDTPDISSMPIPNLFDKDGYYRFQNNNPDLENYLKGLGYKPIPFGNEYDASNSGAESGRDYTLRTDKHPSREYVIRVMDGQPGSHGPRVVFTRDRQPKGSTQNYIDPTGADITHVKDQNGNIIDRQPTHRDRLDRSHIHYDRSLVKGKHSGKWLGKRVRYIGKTGLLGLLIGFATSLFSGDANAAEVEPLDLAAADEPGSMRNNLAAQARAASILAIATESAPGGTPAALFASWASLSASLQLDALEQAQFNNLRQFKGTLASVEDAPFLFDRSTNTLFLINMDPDSPERGSLTPWETLDEENGTYVGPNVILKKGEHDRLYLTQR